MMNQRPKLLYLLGAFLALHLCSSSPLHKIKGPGKPHMSSNHTLVTPANAPVSPTGTIHATTQTALNFSTSNVASNITQRTAGSVNSNNAIASGMVSSGTSGPLYLSATSNGSAFHNFSLNASPAVNASHNVPKLSSSNISD